MQPEDVALDRVGPAGKTPSGTPAIGGLPARPRRRRRPSTRRRSAEDPVPAPPSTPTHARPGLARPSTPARRPASAGHRSRQPVVDLVVAGHLGATADARGRARGRAAGTRSPPAGRPTPSDREGEQLVEGGPVPGVGPRRRGPRRLVADVRRPPRRARRERRPPAAPAEQPGHERLLAELRLGRPGRASRPPPRGPPAGFGVDHGHSMPGRRQYPGAAEPDDAAAHDDHVVRRRPGGGAPDPAGSRRCYDRRPAVLPQQASAVEPLGRRCILSRTAAGPASSRAAAIRPRSRQPIASSPVE